MLKQLVAGVAIAVVFCTLMQPAMAQSAGRGIGTSTCAQFAQQYRANPDVEGVYFTWAQGFLTGWDFSTAKGGGQMWDLGPVGDTTVSNQKYFLRNYCDQHPLESYTSAIGALLNTLPRLPVTATTPTSQSAPPPTSAAAYRDGCQAVADGHFPTTDTGIANMGLCLGSIETILTAGHSVWPLCPQTIAPSAAAGVVARYLDTHPDMTNNTLGMIAVAALTASYPCAKTR